MSTEIIIFILSCFGVLQTAYLIKKRIFLEKPFCLVGENCKVVLESKYNKIFVLHNDVLGLLFYITCSFIIVLLAMNIQPANVFSAILKISVIFGSFFSIILTYLQFKVIKAWCFWCLASALNIWLIGIVILYGSLGS